MLLLRRLKKYLGGQKVRRRRARRLAALNLPIAKDLPQARAFRCSIALPLQTWAWGWRAWRGKRIRQRVDRLACIWPFSAALSGATGSLRTWAIHPSIA